MEPDTASQSLRTNEIGCLVLITRVLRRHLLYSAFGTLITALLQVNKYFSIRISYLQTLGS